MAISDKDRKILWARSGNQCAFCRCELVMKSEAGDDSIIGEECHIVARSSDGPRGDELISIAQLDSYGNLILLCRNHHGVIDNQPNIYTVEVLKKMKSWHEKRIQKSLQHKEKNKKTGIILKRITHGKEVLSLATHSHSCESSYDEPETEQEVELISEFLQQVEYFGDFGEDIESREWVRTGFELTQIILELDKLGFYVFGSVENRVLKLENDKQIDNWRVATFSILRKSNPQIIDLSNVSS